MRGWDALCLQLNYHPPEPLCGRYSPSNRLEYSPVQPLLPCHTFPGSSSVSAAAARHCRKSIKHTIRLPPPRGCSRIIRPYQQNSALETLRRQQRPIYCRKTIDPHGRLHRSLKAMNTDFPCLIRRLANMAFSGKMVRRMNRAAIGGKRCVPAGKSFPLPISRQINRLHLP